MRRFKLPPQILRLVLLTIAIVASYSIARAWLTPASFHEYGWYRGDAIRELASRTPQYAGRKACAECHDDEVHKLAKGEHKTIGCESCHSAGQAHADNPDIKLPKPSDKDCMGCHQLLAGRPKFLKQITLKDHYTGHRCVECHVPHQPSEVP